MWHLLPGPGSAGLEYRPESQHSSSTATRARIRHMLSGNYIFTCHSDSTRHMTWNCETYPRTWGIRTKWKKGENGICLPADGLRTQTQEVPVIWKSTRHPGEVIGSRHGTAQVNRRNGSFVREITNVVIAIYVNTLALIHLLQLVTDGLDVICQQ